MKEWFAKALAEVKGNIQHVIFGHPYTSGAIFVAGYVLGAWTL